MGMWIKSQNKENLVNLDLTSCLEILDDYYLKNRIYATVHDKKIYLGEYSTKEKAFKVFNMIEGRMLMWVLETRSEGPNLGGIIYQKVDSMPVIWNMPNDDEVYLHD